MKESADGVTLRAIPAEEQHAFLWTLAEQLKDAPPGSTVRLRLVE